MSPSDLPGPTYPFTIRAHAPDARIKVYDGHGTLRDEAEGSVSLRLPKGLYTVRVERFGEMKEEVVVHRDGTDRPIDTPLRNSAMPMSDTRHTHEFLQAAARKYSTRSTFPQAKAKGQWPRLMVFVRSASDGPDQTLEVHPGLRLYNEAGDVISDFAAGQIQPDRSDVFAVYSALLKPGNYILAQARKSRIEMLPVSLHQRWDQFIFVPFQRRPLLSRASIKTVHSGEGYDPDDHEAARIDAALQGLGSRLDLLSPGDRNIAIYGKFENPLLGLIGAHSHFLGTDRKEKLERQVLHNLWDLMPGSPDVIALLLMSLDRDEGGLPRSEAELDRAALDAFGHRVSEKLPLMFPPMLSSALQAIMRATQELPDLVGEGSWLEAAGNSSFGSGVWAVWDQPIERTSVRQDVDSKTIYASPPSTQKLYPAVKRAIALAADTVAQDITAQTRLDDIFQPSAFSLERLMMDVDVQGYSLGAAPQDLRSAETVRDLVNVVRQTAQARPVDTEELLISKFGPLLEIEDWLIDAVHDEIEVKQFDAGRIAKRLAVSRHSVERAALLPRPPRDDNLSS